MKSYGYGDNRKGRVAWRLAVPAAMLLLAGCNPARDNLAAFNNIYQGGQLCEAKLFCEQHVKEPVKASGDNLLWALQLAAVERAQKNYDQSNLWFDRCEEMMKVFDQQTRETDVIGTTIVNDNVIPYRGQAYDGVMVNTYKALNFMSLGNRDYARIEFNRAMERQVRARDKFNEEIQKEQARLDKANAEKKVDYSKTTESPDVKNSVAQAYPDLYAFEAYPDFVNPFATYLAGVYFLATGDAGKARDLLRESAGMLPDNEYVRADFAAAEKALGGAAAPRTVWVFFENGLGPVKDEFRIDVPLFLVSSDVLYTGIALPKLVNRGAACERLSVRCDGRDYATQVVGEMDRVVQTEFSKDYPWILVRAIMAAGVKAAAQHYMTDNMNDESAKALVKIFAAAYTAATTTADVRIWSALPKDFQVASMAMPADGRMWVTVAGNRAYPVVIETCDYAIVYVKMIAACDEPLVEVIRY